MIRAKLSQRTWLDSLSRARLRGLFSGLWPLCRLQLLLILGVLAQLYTYGLVGAPAERVARILGGFALGYARGLLLPLPLVVAALNLAPPQGHRRLGWLVFVAVSYSVAAVWLGPVSPEEVALVVFAALTVAVHEYRRRAGVSETSMIRAQIDSIALDRSLARARLQLLRSQAEPHFLFNTLATVRTLARSDRSAGAALIANVMRYLSAALPSLRSDELTLADESALVDAYLSIFKLRMGTRLRYRIHVPVELASIRVASMILLTLVENAIKHGVAPLPEGGSIDVSARQSAGRLELSVVDSGRGLQTEAGAGTGIANLRARLALLHGDAAHLSLAAARPQGFAVTITLPIRRVAM